MATYSSGFGWESWHFNGLIVSASRKHGLMMNLISTTRRALLAALGVQPTILHGRTRRMVANVGASRAHDDADEPDARSTPIQTRARSWYVDNRLPSDGDGTTWAKAWNRLAHVDWNSIAPGDTIYVSG